MARRRWEKRADGSLASDDVELLRQVLRVPPDGAAPANYSTLSSSYISDATETGSSLLVAGTAGDARTAVGLTQQSAIANPTGGTTTDAEARAAINSILSALRTWGLIAS